MSGGEAGRIKDVTSLAEAQERIETLEKGLDDAIDVIMKRDSLLKARERRIVYLEELLDQHGVEYRDDDETEE